MTLHNILIVFFTVTDYYKYVYNLIQPWYTLSLMGSKQLLLKLCSSLYL